MREKKPLAVCRQMGWL